MLRISPSLRANDPVSRQYSRWGMGMIVIAKQGWDEYCPVGKFQWKMPENSGMANTPKITEVAYTGIYK